MQKKLLLTLLTLFLVSPVTAEDNPVTANITLTTDYVWRGISQTNEDPAIQGGLDWSSESGFYVGTWGSNVDYGSVEHMELDLYLGYSTELTNGLGLDFGFIQYLFYDDANDADINEIYAGLSYADFSGKISHDFDNENTYFELGYEADLGNDFGLGLHVGRYDFDAGGDYTDYAVVFSKAYAELDFALAYYDTNISNVDVADGRVVFSVAKSF